jgi:hypothetical protein
MALLKLFAFLPFSLFFTSSIFLIKLVADYLILSLYYVLNNVFLPRYAAKGTLASHVVLTAALESLLFSATAKNCLDWLLPSAATKRALSAKPPLAVVDHISYYLLGWASDFDTRRRVRTLREGLIRGARSEQ